VVTLSDDSKERRPVWPFTPNIVHWNLPDPATTDEPPEGQREASRRVRDEIRWRVREFLKQLVPELRAQSV
jgi:protein-tyrosine-phosphatase